MPDEGQRTAYKNYNDSKSTSPAALAARNSPRPSGAGSSSAACSTCTEDTLKLLAMLPDGRAPLTEHANKAPQHWHSARCCALRQALPSGPQDAES